MDNAVVCSCCGRPLPAIAPEGLCPECLMKAGLGSEVEIASVTADSEARGQGRKPFQPPTAEEIAGVFPQLEVLSLIGRGGMGAVYKARQKHLDRVVALKILPPGIGEDAAFAERFAGEAKAMARLSHPGIVTIHDFGQAGGLFYFVMEFVDGVTLRQLLNAGRLSPREALAIVPQLCDALQYAHDQGIVHRDIKPENILLDRQGRVKVTDFGLAKLVGLGAETVDEAGPASESSTLTVAGKVMGTPAYMAPEQREHPAEVDHRADIYSLGVVLYQMLTGELPGGPIEPPSKKVQVDVRLDAVVLKALESEPQRRYAQASVLKTQVEDIANTMELEGSAVVSGGRSERSRRRHIVRLAAIGSLIVLGAVAIAFLAGRTPFGARPQSRPHGQETAALVSREASPATQPGAIDRGAWARRLAALEGDDWRPAFQAALELADLPPEDGFAILSGNWAEIDAVEARQQMLKGWYLAGPYPLHLRNHPRILDVLNLGMRDPSPKVQAWAQQYLRWVAFQDFAGDFPAYEPWYQANRGKPIAQVIRESARRFIPELQAASGEKARKLAQSLADGQALRDMPEAREGAIESGLPKTIEQWIAAGVDPNARRSSIGLATQGLRLLADLDMDEEYLQRVVVPLLAKEVPGEIRAQVVPPLGRKKSPWAIDTLIGLLESSLNEDSLQFRTIAWSAATALGEIGDPKAIPAMIGVINADNTYDTVYGVGYFGLSRLTGVQYQESHDGAWWRDWWEKNKGRYPAAVQAMKIPELSKRTRLQAKPATPEDPLADVADVPAQDLQADGDAKKRYFLIGSAGKADGSANGQPLLIVLPGDEGSAEFHPFIRRIYQNVLDKRWLIAQLVAPKWDDNQFNEVVWPTEGSLYPAAKFTTEAFVEAVVKDVRAKATIDPKRVFLLGWSSGGPPCYATALRKNTPVTGAYIAMSVFRPGSLPAIENLKGRAFYLLQSPDDRVAPIQHAEAAKRALEQAGAAVKLEHYEGGHGWQGNIWGMMADGVAWLEEQTATGSQ